MDIKNVTLTFNTKMSVAAVDAGDVIDATAAVDAAAAVDVTVGAAAVDVIVGAAAVDAVDAIVVVDAVVAVVVVDAVVAVDVAPAIVVVSAAVVVVVANSDIFKTEKEQLHSNMLKQCLIQFAPKSNQNYLCTYAIFQPLQSQSDRLLHTRVNVGSVK